MVHLKTSVLAVVCLQLLFFVDEAYGKCINDTEICSKMGDNKCDINGITYCCASKDRVIRATYSDDENVIFDCTCDVPSASNSGHRCTKRSISSAPGMLRTSATSFLTCAAMVLVVFLPLAVLT